MHIKLTNMLSIFADSLGQASNFHSIVISGCSPAANLIFPACLGKCLETKPDKLASNSLRREGAITTEHRRCILNLWEVPSRAASGPLGRVQLRNPGSSKIGKKLPATPSGHALAALFIIAFITFMAPASVAFANRTA